MALLYGRAGCLTAENGGFRPGRTVDESFRTLGAAGRSVQGWSKGGQGALLLALKHPAEFCSVAAFAPGLAMNCSAIARPAHSTNMLLRSTSSRASRRTVPLYTVHSYAQGHTSIYV